MDEVELERQKDNKLKNRLTNIISSIESLEKDNSRLISLLENSFKINKEIAENEKIEEISKDILDAKESIYNSISIANQKI